MAACFSIMMMVIVVVSVIMIMTMVIMSMMIVPMVIVPVMIVPVMIVPVMIMPVMGVAVGAAMPMCFIGVQNFHDIEIAAESKNRSCEHINRFFDSLFLDNAMSCLH